MTSPNYIKLPIFLIFAILITITMLPTASAEFVGNEACYFICESGNYDDEMGEFCLGYYDEYQEGCVGRFTSDYEDACMAEHGGEAAISNADQCMAEYGWEFGGICDDDNFDFLGGECLEQHHDEMVGHCTDLYAEQGVDGCCKNEDDVYIWELDACAPEDALDCINDGGCNLQPLLA